jgi:tryptophan halogenase
MKFNNICIVGGGSAGWMTASVLLKHFGDSPLSKASKNITLIESPLVGTIGVGESTTQHFNTFVRYLELEDKEWMPACDATYKNSIRFENWGTDQPWQYPFGSYDTGLPPLDYYVWKHYRQPSNNTFQNVYSNAAAVSEQGKLYTPHIDKLVGYHIDATKFATYLKDKFCLPRGLNYIRETVDRIDTNGDNIEKLTLDDGREITADLFIDCTGFRAILMNRLGVPWEDWRDVLLNDSTWCTKREYVDKARELTSYTSVTALSSGWVWKVPTWNRIGTGYNFSSKFQDKRFALKEFKDHLGCPDAPDSDFRYIRWPTGMREKIWVGNTLAIGLSAGFIEPLESGGLFSVHEFLFNFIQFADPKVDTLSGLQRDWFNAACHVKFMTFRDFVVHHFTAAFKDDTPYWDAATSVYFHTLNQIDCRDIPTTLNDLFIGMQFVLAGLGYTIIGRKEIMDMEAHYDKLYDDEMLKNVDNEVSMRLEQGIQIANNMPVPLDFYNQTLYNTDGIN